MSEAVDRGEVDALALLMTLKTATVGLPLGGGKGGVVLPAAGLTPQQREEVFERIVERWEGVIGPDIDVLGPDVGTGELEMGVLHRAWRERTGRTSGTPATGKPIADGGLAFRTGPRPAVWRSSSPNSPVVSASATRSGSPSRDSGRSDAGSPSD